MSSPTQALSEGLRPSRLWSFAMLYPIAWEYFFSGAGVARMKATAEAKLAEYGPDVTFEPLRADHPARAKLAVEQPLLREMIPMSYIQFDRLHELQKAGGKYSQLKSLIEALEDRIGDEAHRARFYWVKPGFVNYYGNTSAIFGQDTLDKFPSAIDDLEDAGKCLALGQGTATVMHLMRVMEVGLRVLSKALGIPYAPSWESHLKQIAAKIAARHQDKDPDWLRLEAFYRDVSGDLLSVKQTWRNPTMHVGRRYSQEEAQEIFATVRSFMVRLASQLSETQ